jgi:hypothetical protein
MGVAVLIRTIQIRRFVRSPTAQTGYRIDANDPVMSETEDLTLSSAMRLSAQILVGLFNPVRAWWIEDVEINRVFESFRLVRHIAWDGEDFPSANDNFLAIDPKLQSAFENVRDLLVVVTVQGNDAALFHEHAGDHDVSTHHKVPLQKWIQVFNRNCVPRNVLKLRLHTFGRADGSFQGNFISGLAGRAARCCARFDAGFGFRHDDPFGLATAAPAGAR